MEAYLALHLWKQNGSCKGLSFLVAWSRSNHLNRGTWKKGEGCASIAARLMLLILRRGPLKSAGALKW